jgi:hypothetical protein
LCFDSCVPGLPFKDANGASKWIHEPVSERSETISNTILVLLGTMQRESTVTRLTLKQLARCREGQPLFGGVWLASSLALCYAYVLVNWYGQMRDTLLGGTDPFKATSWLPALVGSIVYLSIVLLTRQALKDRKSYDCKRYMLIYNAYQVRPPWLCLAIRIHLRRP